MITMAEVTARKRGSTWSYSFEMAQVDGKRKRKEKGGFRTKKEALEAGVKAKAEYDNSGFSFTPSEISVADYMDYWLENYVKINCSINTVNGYENIIRNHIKPNLGEYKLKSLTPHILQEYINSIYKNGYSKNMLSSIKCVITGSMKYAISTCNFIKTDPSIYLKSPKYERRNRKNRAVVTLNQFNTLITRFNENSNFYIPLMLGYHCGLRIGECFALTWDCIDLNNSTLTIDKTLIYDAENKKWLYGPPKTKTSYRTIFLGDTILNILRKANIKRKENIMKYGEHYTKQYIKEEIVDGKKKVFILEQNGTFSPALPQKEAVCVKEDGELLTPNSFKYCTRVAHYELGMEKFDYHSLRHTHATILIENGANIKDVQERLGHANIGVTMDMYVHNTDKIRKDSVLIFENAINH